MQRNLGYATLMSATLELRVEPHIKNSYSLLIRDKAGRQYEYVAVVVLTCELCNLRKPAERSTHLRMLVERDGHTLARAADAYGTRKLTLLQCLGHRVGIVGVVTTLLRVATEIEHLEALGREVARQKLFQVVACVVASDTYFIHIVMFYVFYDASRTTNIQIISEILYLCRAMRVILVIIGSVSLALGVVGIFFPLLPTTPFLLLSAAAWLKASPSLYAWLINHRVLGEYIRNFREYRALPLRVKVISVSLVWLTIGYCIFAVVAAWWWAQLLMVLLATAITWHILSYATLKK